MLQTNKQVQDNRTQMQLFSLSHSYAYLLGCFPAKYTKIKTKCKNQMIQEKQNIDGMKELCFEQELKVLVAVMKTV